MHITNNLHVKKLNFNFPLQELQESLRPSLYSHQSLRSMNETDKKGDELRKLYPQCIITMAGNGTDSAAIRNLVCVEPYGFRQFRVIAGLYFDTAVGIQ